MMGSKYKNAVHTLRDKAEQRTKSDAALHHAYCVKLLQRHWMRHMSAEEEEAHTVPLAAVARAWM